MGIDYRTYAGPYAVCRVEIVDMPNHIRVCINQVCKRYHEQSVGWGGTYCSHCGTLTAEVNFPERNPAINSYGVQEQIYERLSTPGGDAYYLNVRETGRELWVPNTDMPGMEREPHLDEADFYHIALPVNTIERETALFRTVFDFEITYLKEAYGNVSIEWGIIQDYL